MEPLQKLTEEQWSQYDRDGFVVLRGVLPPDELQALNARLDDLMSGAVNHGEALLMQLDPSAAPPAAGGAAVGAPSAAAEAAAYEAAGVASAGQSRGFKGPSRAYRKIGEAGAGLEVDPLFMAAMRRPLLRAVADRVYGAHAAISVYRAMVMCKPAGPDGGGSSLPWHQDGGDWWSLDRDPLAFIWIALSDATRENGAVQVVRGSHRLGILSRRGHTLEPAAVAALVGDGANVVDVELQPGDAFLCHNWTVHRSGVNSTDAARRGFSVNLVDARTRVLDPRPALAGPIGEAGQTFPLVFPSPFA